MAKSPPTTPPPSSSPPVKSASPAPAPTAPSTTKKSKRGGKKKRHTTTKPAKSKKASATAATATSAATTPPTIPEPVPGTLHKELVGQAIERQMAPMEKLILLKVDVSGEIEIAEFSKVQDLIDAIKAEEGNEVHLIPVAGYLMNITPGPMRFLVAPQGRFPLFDIPEYADDIHLGYMGLESKQLVTPLNEGKRGAHVSTNMRDAEVAAAEEEAAADLLVSPDPDEQDMVPAIE